MIAGNPPSQETLPVIMNLMKDEFSEWDRFCRVVVRAVVILTISAFALTVILNFELIMGLMLAFIVLAVLGACTKFS